MDDLTTDPDGLAASAREEIGFWERELALEGKHPEVVQRRLDPETRIEEFPPVLLHQVIPFVQQTFELEGPARCVEIGSGPLSTLAHGVEAGLLDLTAVDVLAEAYGELLERTGNGDFPVRPVAGAAETLLDVVPEDECHIAFARNALDHTDDIARSFDSLVRTLLPGGALVLEHHLREGTRQQWSDSHHWDLDVDGGALVATGRSGQRLVLSERDDLELVYLQFRSDLLDGWIEHVFRRL